MKIEPKCIFGSITIDKTFLPRTYGIVNRSGRIFFRNYNRNIKNGKTFIDVFFDTALNKAAEEIETIYNKGIFKTKSKS
jgi:hypothetical protein